jgi:hypothetical protein
MFDGWTRLFSLKKNSGNAADCFPMLQNSSQSMNEYDEKDTASEKILRCVADFSRNVTYFAATLSNPLGNWHERVHSTPKR